MKIKNDIVCDYVAGKSILSYKEEWFFRAEGYSFEEPSYVVEHKEAVGRIFKLIIDSVKDFYPCNVSIWDALFPTWRHILEDITINLIIGFPEPNDATVLKSPDGQYNVILDLGLWAKYEGKCDIESVVHNLLTHELCHVCISKTIADIDDDIDNGDYISQLDANTFHEGFAHLVSYDDKDINKVDWNSEKLQQAKYRSIEMMQLAISSSDISKQKEYLYNAVYGDYYDKYACMCGMFYLVDCWKNNNIPGLVEEFKEGYKGFSKRTIVNYK